jgi:hypothetical protein
MRPLCGLRMSRLAVRHALKSSWKDTWQNTMCDDASQPTLHFDRNVETKMPLDHELPSIAEDRGPLDHSPSGDQHRLAYPAASAASVLCSSEVSLVSCVYIALLCSHCGDLRQALAELPNCGTVACPECTRNCRFVLLGSGLTKRELPFHEIHSAEQTCWDRPSEEKDDSS